MIPANALTPTPIIGNFLPPTSLPYTPLSQIVYGGVALNDATHGRNYQYWTVEYDGSHINVGIQGQSTALQLTPTGGVSTVSLAFDTNMSPVVAWTIGSTANLYYYDTVSSAYITRVFNVSGRCRVAVDNSQTFYNGNSDVLLAYTNNGTLYYRQQRDRYNTEYTVGTTTASIQRMGMSTANRFQFELA